MTSLADQEERAAFLKIKKILGNPRSFAAPAGSSPRFPDFGFTMKIEGEVVDLHFEFKGKSARMGSCRRWRFDGDRFYTKEDPTPDEEITIAALNTSEKTVDNAKKLLVDMQSIEPDVQEIHNGSFTIVKDMKVRKTKLDAFQKLKNRQLATKIVDPSIGESIVERYKRKFRSVKRAKAKYSVLLMVVHNKMWFIDESGTLDEEQKRMLARLFGAESLPLLPSLEAQIECRVSTSGPKIDTIAEARLTKIPSGGLEIY